MNIAAVIGAPASAAPASSASSSARSASDNGETPPFANLLHAAREPNKPPAQERHADKPATKAEAQGRAAGGARTGDKPKVDKPAADKHAADKRSLDKRVTRSDGDDVTDAARKPGDDADAADAAAAPGDPAALLAGMLNAAPRAAGQAGKAKADAGATSGVAAHAARTAKDAAGLPAAGIDATSRAAAEHAALPEGAESSARDVAGPAFTLPGLPAAAGATSPPPPAADAPTTGADPRIAAPVHSPEFAPALGAQVSLLIKDGVQEARLQLHPAELGPINVQIQIDGQNAQVTMTAEQAVTRERLEQALPALAGALQDNGLTLTGGGVFEQPRQPQGRDAQRGDGSPGQGSGAGAGNAADDPASAAALPRRVAARGAVDLYA